VGWCEQEDDFLGKEKTIMEQRRWMGYIQPYEMTSLGIRACTAGWLSYLFGWISAIVFLVLERQNRFVRFHAMQALLFSLAWMVFEAIMRTIESLFGWLGFGFMPFGFVPFLGFGVLTGIAGIIVLIVWIRLMVRAARGWYYKLPVIGDFAETYANQSRW
jgi:uncharacterized membrane protein